MTVDRSILVIGGTGRQGGAVARELLARGRSVHALVRDRDSDGARALEQAGARLVGGDLDDDASLRAAVEGMHGVFSVQTFRGPGGVEGELRQGMALATAAARAGVAHFVYSSVGGAERSTGVPHFESKWQVEQHIESLGLPATVLRPVMFHDVLLDISPRPVGDEQVLGLWLRPETSVQMVATRDIGAFAADAFESPEEWMGRKVEIASDELTGPEIAAAFEAVSGIATRFESLPIEPLRAHREDLARMFDWFERDGYQADLPELRRRRPDLVTFEAWLRTRAVPAPVS